jgi:site-specific DNA-methyltransferase (adenine-specific)
MIIHGDCVDVMEDLIKKKVRFESIVTDPPYELGFMGKDWDKSGIANSKYMWSLAFNLLQPGGYLLAFSSTRTYHRMVVAIEDAGFEIRDMISWLYGQGFPKSLNLSKSISPETDEAKQWQGWGTALKPACEPIVVARKPLIEGYTVSENVLTTGTGGLNIDDCRVAVSDQDSNHRNSTGGYDKAKLGMFGIGNTTRPENLSKNGRWPANVVHDGSDEVEEAFAAFGESKSQSGGRSTGRNFGQEYSDNATKDRPRTGHNDSGTASRFFYCAKANKRERAGSKHPTVKPLALMKWLVTLVTPPDGTVLDPFCGTGTTCVAAKELGFNFVGIELDEETAEFARNRLDRKDAIVDLNEDFVIEDNNDLFAKRDDDYEMGTD